MKIVILHTAEAIEEPADPVIHQLDAALRSLGHTPRAVVVGSDVIAVASALRSDPPDLVFNLAESFAGKSALESNVAGLLNMLDLRYTGSSPAGLLVAGDKGLTKKVLGFHGILTPASATVYRGDVEFAQKVRFPLIVKPVQEDASIGISARSVVTDVSGLLRQIDLIHGEHGQPALVEEFIDGREFYIGVLGNADPAVLPAIELDFSAFPPGRPKIASWEAKWGHDGAGGADSQGAEFHGTRSVFPGDLPPELSVRIAEAARAAFTALRLRDYARIDIRVSASGDPFVLEVNPNCYLERESEFARAAARMGLEYEMLVARIIELALARYAR